MTQRQQGKKRPFRQRRPRQRQGDYRIFVGAFPTGPLADRIQAVRRRYDAKTARITPPHVTLAGTYWRSGPPTAESEAMTIYRLQTECQKIAPFALLLGGIYRFGNRVVYLGVRRTPEIQYVRRQLLTAIGRDKHRRFRPHLTLAMRLNEAEMAEMIAELKESEWENGRFTAPINTLQLMQRGPDDPAWRTIGSFPLSGTPTN